MKIEAPDKLDYEKEGLICGLEFHQQVLAPYDERPISQKHGSKLFCNCPAILRDEDPDFTITRRLRPVSGETGDIDVSAQFEKMKQAETIYEAYHDTTCLVELDEEPIMPINKEALFRTLAMAKKLFGLNLVDEIYVSRKTIIDGSNTSGFQRTALIGYTSPESFIEVNGKKISIYQANLEEDSAKNMGRIGTARKFRVDRLGIPLIEIATGPDLRSPEEALATAKRIGELLRTTGFVKRGQGTIRQDLNVSIKRGTRIEIKGVSELELLPIYIKNEAIRQVRMLDLVAELKNRGFNNDDIERIKPMDVTKLYKKCNAKFVKKAIKNKQKVIGTVLPKMNGIIKYELQTNYRLGTEFSEIAKVTSGVGGILHSDELPKFGISEDEVNETRQELGAGENDGFMIIITSKSQGYRAIEAIKTTINMWLQSESLIPEVRAPRADGTTGYLRPLPGKARMYPETDIKPIYLTDELRKKIDDLVFEMPEDRVKRYIEELHLSEELANQLAIHPQNKLFEELVQSHNISANLVAHTLLSTLKDLKRKGYNISKISDEDLHEIMEAVASDKISKGSIEQLLISISESKKEISVDKHIKKLGLVKIDDTKIREIIVNTIEKYPEYLERGNAAMGPYMGKVMAALGGKAEGKIVSSILREELSKRIK